jgi:casein kinase 1
VKEPHDKKIKLLLYEAKILRLLASTTAGIPHIYYAGIEGQYNVMVTELLGPSLQDLVKFVGYRFTI